MEELVEPQFTVKI